MIIIGKKRLQIFNMIFSNVNIMMIIIKTIIVIISKSYFYNYTFFSCLQEKKIDGWMEKSIFIEDFIL